VKPLTGINRNPSKQKFSGLVMPYHVAFAINADSIVTVSDTIEAATGFSREGRESSVRGVYDLFRIPEDSMVKYNFVKEENEWDYPDHKDSNVLVIVGKTDRPDEISNLVMGLGLDAVLVEQKQW
jgi:hypothetical protein